MVPDVKTFVPVLYLPQNVVLIVLYASHLKIRKNGKMTKSVQNPPYHVVAKNGAQTILTSLMFFCKFYGRGSK